MSAHFGTVGSTKHWVIVPKRALIKFQIQLPAIFLIRKETDCCLEMLNVFYLSMKTLPMLNMNTDLSIIEEKWKCNCYTLSITFLYEFFISYWWGLMNFSRIFDEFWNLMCTLWHCRFNRTLSYSAKVCT